MVDPVIGKLGADQLVLLKDDTSVFIDNNGDLTYHHSFTWSDNPLAVGEWASKLLCRICLFLKTLSLFLTETDIVWGSQGVLFAVSFNFHTLLQGRI